MRPIYLLLLLLPSQAFAQHSLEWSYGFSLKTAFIKAGLNYTGHADLTTEPVLVASYEYRFHPLFGLGVGYTQQGMTGNYTYTWKGQEDRIEFDYQRRSFIVEPKLYYPLGLEQLEIYSGVRLGYRKEDLDASSTLNNVNEILELTDLVVGGGLNASLTALGLNYHPTSHVGVGVGFNVIGPYLVKGGLLIRF